MTRQKRQRAERPFARVVSDKQEAAATIADRRFAFALGLRCVTASADRIVGNEASARRPTPDGCWTELFQPMPLPSGPLRDAICRRGTEWPPLPPGFQHHDHYSAGGR